MIRRLQLLSQHVLGINRRNQELIARYNPRTLFQVVDHKVKTKEVLSALGVPVVDTLAVYRFQYDIRRFADDSHGWREFVVKPAQGAGGEGVVIVVDQREDLFLAANSRTWSKRQLE